MKTYTDLVIRDAIRDQLSAEISTGRLRMLRIVLTNDGELTAELEGSFSLARLAEAISGDLRQHNLLRGGKRR